MSCSGGDGSPSGPGDTTPDPQLPEQPHPASVSVTPDPSHAVSARIPTTGGTLQTTGADGTAYTLTVPAGALLMDTTISMTPLASVSGLNLPGAHMTGVQLEPDGLQFYQFATLSVAPPEGAHHSAIAFSYHGAGSDIYRVPLTPDPDVLEIPVLHFSGNLIYLGDGHWVSPEALAIIPENPDDQLATLLGDLFRDDRDRVLQGLPRDPELAAKEQHILQAFYDEVIEPSLATMKTDCNAARTLIPRGFRWERTLELLGFHDQFEAQEGTIHDAVVTGLENCFNKTKGDCLDTSDPVQMNEAVMISHQLAVFGVEDPAYNPLNPELQCSRGWSGTATSTAQFAKDDGSQVLDIITSDVQWEIDSVNTRPGIQTQYRIKRGSISWEQKGTDQFGCTHQGGPVSFDLGPQDGAIAIDEVNHTYQATGIASHFTQASVTCPPGQPSYTADVSLGPWLITPVSPYPANATELSGTYDYPGLNTTFVWQFDRAATP